MQREYPRGETIRWDGTLHPLVKALPHYWIVPKDPAEHLAYRLKVYRAAADNPSLQADLWRKCQEDVLFFFNTFLFVLEPRAGQSQTGIVPFNTWVHQDPVIANAWHYLGVRHQVGDKSRAQGASYIAIGLILWAFLFRPNSIMGMGSKDEETADDPTSPDSLGWKFDFMLANLPEWMRPPGLTGDSHPNRNMTKSTWRNVRNGSYLKALASTSGIGRGGRYFCFLLDESAFFLPGKDREAVANLLHTTDCLLMWSTPNTPDCEHYERVHPQRPTMWLTLILDWQDNPEQKLGLYTTRNGKLLKLDPDYQYSESYAFILDGRRRSPWFDGMCEIMNWNYLLIERELCRSWTASVGKPYQQSLLDKHRVYCKSPIHTGTIAYFTMEPTLYEQIQWLPGEGYRFDLWCPLDGNLRPPEDQYTFGIDPSYGTGGETSNNSALAVFNSRSEQVAEFASNSIDPLEFARFCVASAYWFGHGRPTPFLIWERNGPGIPFTTEVMRLRYQNVYYQKASDDTRKYSKTLDRPGYHTSDTQQCHNPLIGALERFEVVIRSFGLLEEAAYYEYDGKRIIHPKSKTTRDKSASGESHGDRVVAAAMAMRAVFDRPSLRTHPGDILPEKCPPNSIGGRVWQWEQEQCRKRNFLARA